jgi:hypothetical protein
MIQHQTIIVITSLLISLNCFGQRQRQSQRDSELDRGVRQPSEIYREVVRSTVTVVSEIGLGSGFYVTSNVIATNYHVVKGAEDVYCVPNNSDAEYQVTGYMAVDEEADLILLRVAGQSHRPLTIASGSVVTGQVIYAIGTPQGMDGTISDGIVSSVRNVDDIKLLQITAPISEGSSGGPVVNRLGQVVGISTLMHTGGQNLNFAVDYRHLSALMRRMYDRPVSLSSLNKPSRQQRGSSYGSESNSGSRNSDRQSARSSSSSQNGNSQTTTERFRRDYNYITYYDPDDEEWSEWTEGASTVVFNINSNGDIRIYYAGKTEVFRKISQVVKDTADGGEEYQRVMILDEKGDEQLLQLFNNGDMMLIFANGVMIQLTNKVE